MDITKQKYIVTATGMLLKLLKKILLDNKIIYNLASTSLFFALSPCSIADVNSKSKGRCWLDGSGGGQRGDNNKYIRKKVDHSSIESIRRK